MQTFFNVDTKRISKYKNNSQKIRVLSEQWVSNEIFCPHCGESKLGEFENNCPVADFYCKNCGEEYELKSQKNKIGDKILDGAYRTMIGRLQSNNNPNFFFLSYAPGNYFINNFMVVPKHFFVPSVIKKRKPLSLNAKRHGWIGCDILLNKIPNDGKISYIKDGKVTIKEEVLENYRRTVFLRDIQKMELRGWLLDIMNCISVLGTKEFNLQDIYDFENILAKKYPKNKNIKPKIRQQLQFLRDKGYLVFLGGRYRVK